MTYEELVKDMKNHGIKYFAAQYDFCVAVFKSREAANKYCAEQNEEMRKDGSFEDDEGELYVVPFAGLDEDAIINLVDEYNENWDMIKA